MCEISIHIQHKLFRGLGTWLDVMLLYFIICHIYYIALILYISSKNRHVHIAHLDLTHCQVVGIK